MKKYNNPYAANTQKDESGKKETPRSKSDSKVSGEHDALGKTTKGKDFADHKNVGEGDAELPPGGSEKE